MRCSSCNKFCSLDSETEPEVELDVEGDRVTGSVRIVNCCAECGEEVAEFTFEIDQDLTSLSSEHKGEGHDLEVEEGGSERTCRTEGKGRGTRTFYGFSASYTVKCSCGKFQEEGSTNDEVQASGMDQIS